jgi:hypothetical protein
MLSSKGALRSLDHLPKTFHPYITVVTGEKYAESVAEAYPQLPAIWVTPDSINSAASKRKLIMSSYKEDYAILLNDDVTVHQYNAETKKFVRCDLFGSLFSQNLKQFLEVILSGKYKGVSFHDRAFSKQLIDDRASKPEDQMLVKNGFIGAAFWIDKEVARSSEFELGRLNYYEDIDYSLQLL